MASPLNGSQAAITEFSDTGVTYIDALLGGIKWGGALGSSAALTFSFPYSQSGTAMWASNPSYSDLNEPSSSFGLDAQAQAAARAALSAWSNVANVTFTEVADSATDVGDIRFAWTTLGNGGSAAWAGLPNNSFASGGDVWLHHPTLSPTTNSFWQAGGVGALTLLHEVGHALGFKHPFEDQPRLPAAQDTRQYTVMSYQPAPKDTFHWITVTGPGTIAVDIVNILPDTPMLYDIAAMQTLYGANMGYRTGDDLYTFDPNTPFFRTLWDGGGNDTISVANFSRGTIINLLAGHT